MSLADIISKWDETFSGRISRPELEDLARSNKRIGRSNAITQAAIAANAPQRYRGEARDTENKAGLSGLELQFAPQMTQADLESKRAQTGYTGENTRNLNFKNENPLFGQTGMAGQLGSLIYLQNHPELLSSFEGGNVPRKELPGNVGASNEKYSPWKREDLEISPEGIGRLKNLIPNQGIGSVQNAHQQKNDMISLLRDSITNDIKRKNAYGELANKKVENYGYGQLTADQKRRWVAEAQGMGVSENDSREFFNKGFSIEDLAEAKGFDANNLPEAIYSPTSTDIQRIHFRQQAVNELNTIQPLLTEAIAPYAQMIDGYSPEQIMEAMRGDNPDAQARFLAARGLMPEMAALRVKAMGGQVGIEAINKVLESSMGNINSFQGLVSPEVYAKAQQYMDEWINLGVEKANSVGLNPEKAQNKEIGSKKDTGVSESKIKKIYSDEDIKHTAKKYGITINQVKQKLGIL